MLSCSLRDGLLSEKENCMYNIVDLSRLLLIVIFISLHHYSAEARRDVDSILLQLDRTIDDADIYCKQVESKIDRIKAQISPSLKDSEKCELYQELFDSYLHFQADSALHYLNVRAKMVESIEDADQKARIGINRAEVYGIMGMHNEMLHELEKLSVEGMSLATRGYYYRTFRAYYGWIADYTPVASAKVKYLDLTDNYRDSILMFDPIETNKNMIGAERLLSQNQADRAIEELSILLPLTDDKKQQVYIHFNLAKAYLQKGDIDQAIIYLAKTAIYDLKMGTREYASLQLLANTLYQIGDVDRAYRYLSRSMQDAVDSNARLRYMEVTRYFPIINSAYSIKDELQRSTTTKLLIIISVIAVILITLVIYLLLNRRRLTEIKSNLANSNHSLKVLNSRLAEKDRIKEIYIARYLERCVTYIDKLDLYRRSLKRLAATSKTEELLKALQSEQMLQRERKEFYAEFDQSFLALFPNFVDNFNSLLNEQGCVKLKSERQLNTELRIYALIRLGITDAAQIAHFLDYSLATVYSYRSKMRSRALGDKDTFEQRVMEL